MSSLHSPAKITYRFAEWVNRIPESEIRRLLRFSPKYYFAGGKPGILPIEIFHEIIQEQISDEKNFIKATNDIPGSYNYGRTEGNIEFREILAKRLYKNENISVKPEDVIISTGSQQMLYALSDVFLNPGDIVLTTNPTYLGFISPAEKMKASIITLPTDKEGLIPEYIDSAMELAQKKFKKTPKLLYTIPYSDNPGGTSLPEKRKKSIIEKAFTYENLLVIEDVAYKEIRFNNEPITSMKQFDKDNEKVAYLSTSSKEAAVFRVGYSVVPNAVKEAIVKIKGYYDLNTPEWTQVILSKYYEKYIASVLPNIRKGYEERAKAIIKALEEYMPYGDFTRPTGGFFVWYRTRNTSFDSLKFISEALKKEVSYVPGKPFYPAEGFDLTIDNKLQPSKVPMNTFRLGYSLMNPEMITKGIKVLASCLIDVLD